MKNLSAITSELVKKITSLARLPVSEENLEKLQKELEATFEYINKIQALDTSKVEETSQVTGLENISREDIVDEKRMLSQTDALANAPSTYKGYFKVKAIFDEE